MPRRLWPFQLSASPHTRIVFCRRRARHFHDFSPFILLSSIQKGRRRRGFDACRHASGHFSSSPQLLSRWHMRHCRVSAARKAPPLRCGQKFSHDFCLTSLMLYELFIFFRLILSSLMIFSIRIITYCHSPAASPPPASSLHFPITMFHVFRDDIFTLLIEICASALLHYAADAAVIAAATRRAHAYFTLFSMMTFTPFTMGVIIYGIDSFMIFSSSFRHFYSRRT